MNINEITLNLLFSRSIIAMIISFIFLFLSIALSFYYINEMDRKGTLCSRFLTLILSTICSISSITFLITGTIKLLLIIGIVF